MVGCFDWSAVGWLVVGWLVVGLYTADLIRPVGESSERAQQGEVAQGGNTSISSRLIVKLDRQVVNRQK